MEIVGRQVEIGVATEATRGTAETSADKWLRNTTANVVERATHAEDETTRGVLEEGEGRRAVQTFVEGDIAGILHADAIGYFLANLYGIGVSSQVGATSVYSHVFNIKQNIEHQSLTLFAKDGGVQQLVFANCMINTLQISAAIDDYVRYTASFSGGAATDNSDTPSYDTEYDFIARDIVIKMAATEAGLSGASAIPAKNVDWTYDQGTIRDHVVGKRPPADIYNGRMMITGSMELNFTDETYKDLFLGDTAQYMSITITGEADLDDGNNPEIELILYKVQISDWNRGGDANELVTQTVGFKAYFNETDQKQSQTTIQNLTTSYPNVPTS
jgi:hypothetical protein